MSVIGSNILAGASGQGGGYNLTKSLRFRSSATAYLNRTPASAGNRQIWTWSGWFKRGILGQDIYLFTGESGSNNDEYSYVTIKTDDKIRLVIGQVGSNPHLTDSAAVFRDPSAWYHIVSTFDSTQATAANRWRLYVNGVEQTMSGTVMSQNYNSGWINNNNRHGIMGRLNYATNTSDGYLAEVNFIDGQALTPSSFGETSTTTGVWIPKKYTGTYGTNGFYLPFTDTTSTSTLGTDFSGNSNTWTVNNISLTSGSTYDSMTDVPTLTSATTANYAVLNPLDKGGNVTITDGNLSYSVGATNMARATFQIPTTGKWYWECTQTSTNAEQFGIATSTASLGTYLGGDANGWSYGGSGNKFNNNSSSAYGASFTNGDVIGVAFDADAGTLTFYKNNTSQGTAFSSLTGTYFPAVGGNLSSGAVNFGQRPFSYTPPTGFVALNTFNLPTPDIGATASTTANKYFDINTYTGDGSQTASFTNSGSMQPDLVWSRIRSGTPQAIGVFDSVRGTTGQSLDTAATTAEGTWNGALSSEYGYVSAFNSNGFSVNDGSVATTGGYVNFSGRTYVAWQWRASNATAVTNTAGSITSTVSANTTAGFSIVTYTGNGTSGATVGHGLGVAPSMYIVKTRSTTESWITYHISIGATNYLALNLTQASSAATAAWNNTAPTSTVFSLGNAGSTNGSGNTFVAYCFAPVAGYSAFGSYTGNGSSDGPFIFTGFRPRYLMIKRTDSSNNWVIQDTSRDTYNVSEKDLYADTSGAEATYVAEKTDILSNGFKQRQTGASMNASGGTYIYMAFAESPFRYSNAR